MSKKILLWVTVTWLVFFLGSLLINQAVAEGRGDSDPQIILRIPANDTLTLKSGNYYFNEIKLEKNAKLITQDAVRLFITGPADFSQGEVINKTKDASQFVIISSGQDKDSISLPTKGTFCGAIYAPEATVIAKGKGLKIIGAIVGNNIKIEGEVDFQYDPRVTTVVFSFTRQIKSKKVPPVCKVEIMCEKELFPVDYIAKCRVTTYAAVVTPCTPLGTYEWTKVDPKGKIEFIGPTDKAKVAVHGIKQSDAKGDVTLAVKFTPKDGKPVTETLDVTVMERIIVIDAGHGGRAPGAEGKELKEKNVTLAIAKELREKLSALPEFQVPKGHAYMMREADETIEPEERAMFTACLAPHLFISIHLNSDGPAVTGTETWIPSDATNTEEDFAQEVHQRILNVVEQPDRGIKSKGDITKDFIVIRHSLNGKTNGILCEVAFITNPETETKLKDPEFLDAIAEAMGEGINETFEQIEDP